MLVVLVLLIALVSSHPPIALFALFCCYGISGYVVYAQRKWKGRYASLMATSTDEPDEAGLH